MLLDVCVYEYEIITIKAKDYQLEGHGEFGGGAGGSKGKEAVM